MREAMRLPRRKRLLGPREVSSAPSASKSHIALAWYLAALTLYATCNCA